MKTHGRVTVIASMCIAVFGCGILVASEMGDRIESSAKKSYVFMTYLKADDIKFDIRGDTEVVLTGTVSEWSHRALAEEAVAGLPGVKYVDNKLEIRAGHPLENSDEWIALKIKTMLMFHNNVSGIKTNVDVKDGVVTLHGPASSEAQKELTAEYARDVEGVKGVDNRMTVEKPGKTPIERAQGFIDDASITAQVKLALLFHRSTNAIDTWVRTKDGTVTVKGIAKNAAEKDLVGRLVKDIRGVKRVENEMTVERGVKK